jgi:hypothetical protein
VRDLYLQNELDALDVAGGANAEEEVTFARQLGRPVLDATA